ncbi:MAG: pantetheine-phosphate adenylyltransferase [Nitrospinota bacterium]|nr:MAG: pantetheine-phosphate adenylyltransferase [Nitrospinota bacterium]
MERIAVYPGTFDPVTNGHIDLMRRALRLFDRLIVALFDNFAKEPMFPIEQRKEFIRIATADMPGIEVDSFNTLLVDYVRQKGAHIIIRGLRATYDFDYEYQMTLMNRRLDSSIETVILMPTEEYFYVSSTLIKEVAALGGEVKGLVPEVVERALMEKLGRRRT